MRRQLLLLPTTAIIFFFSACAVLAPMQFSRPVSSQADIRMSKNGIISLPGLDLKVVPRNDYYSWALLGLIIPAIPIPSFLSPPDRSQFEILIVLDPEGEDFALDPGRIALELSDRQVISPVGFRRGPGAFSAENAEVLLVLGETPSEDISCDVDLKATVWLPTAPIPVSNRTCFVLVFALPPPSPKQQFTLSIDGIIKAGQPFPIPPIHFEKGWKLFFAWF